MSLQAILDLVRPGIRQVSAYKVLEQPEIEVKLDANEFPYELPGEMREALAAELAQKSFNRYPDPNCTELREILAAEYRVRPESLLFGNGSDEIIQLLLTTFARPKETQERARVLFPEPTFSVFSLLATTLGVESHTIALSSSFQLDPELADAKFSEARPNLAFFARPNNPTGTLWPQADLLKLVEEYADCLFVSDEAYGEYCEESLVSALTERPNLLVMKTLSKVGLAGLRVGFAIAHCDIIAELNKARAPYNLSAVNQAAAVWILRHARQWINNRCSEIVRERERVRGVLRSLEQVKVFESEANLLLFRVGQAGAGKGELWWKALIDKKILLRYFGQQGPLADCLRMSIGTPEENDRVLCQLEKLAKSL